MSKKYKIIYAVLAFVALITVILFYIAFKNFTATTMSVESTNGDVSLFDNTEKELEIFEGMRLRGGNSIKTGSDGLADVLLDKDRIVVVREKSHVSFHQRGKKLRLDVEDGDVFFHIRNKLDSGEELKIDTVTMSIGIRGTSGLTAVHDKKEALYLTSGKVSIDVSDPDGEKEEEYDLKAGEVLKCDYSDGELKVTKETFLPEDMPRVLLEEITKDIQLLKTVLDETGWEPYDLILAAEDMSVELDEEIYAYLLEVSDLDETEPEVADITEEAEDEEFVPLPYEGWGGLYSGSNGGTYYYVWLEDQTSMAGQTGAGTIRLLWKGNSAYLEGTDLTNDTPHDIFYDMVDNGYLIRPGWNGEDSSILTIDEDDMGNLSGRIFCFGFWLQRDNSLGYDGKTMKYMTGETGDAKNSDELVDDLEWRNAYYEYFFGDDTYYNGLEGEIQFRTIYLDGDNVPEIVFKEHSFDDALTIASYDRKNGVHELLQVYCETAYYIPRSGYMYYDRETWSSPQGYYRMTDGDNGKYGFFEYTSENAPAGVSGNLEKIGDFYLSMTEGGMDYLQMQSYLD